MGTPSAAPAATLWVIPSITLSPPPWAPGQRGIDPRPGAELSKHCVTTVMTCVDIFLPVGVGSPLTPRPRVLRTQGALLSAPCLEVESLCQAGTPLSGLREPGTPLACVLAQGHVLGLGGRWYRSPGLYRSASSPTPNVATPRGEGGGRLVGRTGCTSAVPVAAADRQPLVAPCDQDTKVTWLSGGTQPCPRRGVCRMRPGCTSRGSPQHEAWTGASGRTTPA